MVPAQGGEDTIAKCQACLWASSNVSEEIKKAKACPKCAAELEFYTAIEVGHIFKLGTKYSEALGARFLDADGKEKAIIMGCYGIGVNRIMASAIEQSHDKDGIIWPPGISPYQVLIIPLNVQQEVARKAAFELYETLKKYNLDVLLDERDERAGLKLKDADLIGIPVQVIIGEKKILEGKVEIKLRASGETRIVAREEAAAKIAALAGHKL
ncbi:MAG: His/Gly/Thr/Pro-type tRNA ligase C-terminal domain-containing protein [Candidatus Omnitrophota bacterium]